MFPMKKYYYIVLHYREPDNVISYGKINREMFVSIKCATNLMNKAKDILKLKNVYSSRFLKSQIELTEESEKFKGFILSSDNSKFLFTESNTFGSVLNYFFSNKKTVRNEVKLVIEIIPFKISSIIIKSTNDENSNDLTTILEYNAFTENSQGKTGEINFTGIKYTI
jgi:hypothetical protein